MPIRRPVLAATCAALLSWPAAASPCVGNGAPGEADELPTLRPDGSLTFELGEADQAQDGPERRRFFELRVEHDGPVTLGASSSDGDPYLRLLDATGRVRQADDDGGVLWDARLVVDARADTPLVLDAGIKSGTGRLQVEARAGDVPAPSGEAGALAEIDALEARGRASVARGRNEGAYDLYEAAERVQQHGRRARARALLALALPPAERLVLSKPAGAEGVRALRLLAWTHARLGEQAAYAGEVDEAEPHLEDARAYGAPLDEPLLRAFVGDAQGALDLVRGDLSAAEEQLRATIGESDTHGLGLFAVRARDRLAECALRQGDLPGARALHDEALRVAFEQPGDAGRDLQEEALLALVQHLLARDEVTEASDVLDGLLAGGVDGAHRVAALGHRAEVEAREGRYDAAFADLEDALSLVRALGDASLESQVLLAGAEIARWTNDLDTSLALLRQARELAGADGERALDVDLRLRALARVTDVGRVPAAADLLERARSGHDPELLARALEAALFDARDRGDLDAALAFADEHLRVVDDASLEHRLGPARLFVAHVHRLRGERDEAERGFAAALDWARVRPEAAFRLDALDEAMQLALDEHDGTRAEALLAEAETLLDGRIVDRDVLSGGLRRAGGTWAVWGRHAQDVVALRMLRAHDEAERVTAASDGFLALGATQARTLYEGLGELDAGARTPEIQRARGELERARAVREASEIALARAQQAGAEPSARRALEDALAQVRDDERARRTALDALLPAARRVPVTPEYGWERVAAAALGEHDLLVDFAEGGSHLYAYVVARDGIAWRDLGERAALDELVQAFVTGTSRPEHLATPPEVVTLGRALRERLVDPWRARLDAVAPDPSRGRLVIVPATSLASLAFEALVLEGPARPENFTQVVFLGDRRQVVYAPSAPVLARLAGESARGPDGPVLVLADPVGPAERGGTPIAALGRRGPPDLARLPGTRDEALALARRVLERDGGEASALDALAGQRDASWDDGRVLLFLGRDATPARLREATRPLAALHCAAHGVVDPDDPSRTGLLLSGDGHDDGFLRASDVLDLALDTDVAVLSACDTGGGPILAGDGVQSLARAFLFAGARSVVASLWQVDDRETQVLMDRFYQGWLDDGLSRAEALLRARRELRSAEPRPGTFVGTGRGDLLPGARAQLERERPSLAGHPFFWASFVYIGAPGD